MDSAGHSESASEPPPSRFSNLLGVLIAFVALGFPLFAIAHFSAADADLPQRPTYTFMRSRE